MKTDAQFPKKLKFLFHPSRYKVTYGGRGSAKSWGYARALLLQGTQQTLRILCAREHQNSIKQSVHALLEDQIQLLGLGGFYEVLEHEIRGANGTTIQFCGLAKQTVESIKSYEGVDIVWIEEAQTVSSKSWKILVPTIRKPNSEIWVSFNPDLDTDPTYERFIKKTPPNARVVKMNYTDNPWFPDVLNQERIHCKLTESEAEYKNIWEGDCKPAVEGAIYANEIIKMQEEKRIGSFRHDNDLKVHVVLDLGWNDAMFVSLCQKAGNKLKIIKTIKDSHRTLDSYDNELREWGRNNDADWGTMFLPHDGKHGDFKTGLSTQQIMESKEWDVEIVPNIGLEEGIKQTRRALKNVYIDEDEAGDMILALKHYRRRVDAATEEARSPVHDDSSHGADNMRYIALSAESMTNEDTDFNSELNYKRPAIV